MLGTAFTHDMIRKYVVAYGTLFNNIKLQRIDPDGGATQWISVPLSYAPKEKWHARLTDPRITQQVAISLPRISYELVTATYAPERKMNTMNRHVAVATDQDKLRTMFAPVPYDFQFSLFVYSRNAADASNIIEQILPFFTPEFTVTINNATDLKINIDCPIILNSVSREDTYEGDFESRRVVTWTLDFTMKGLLFGPVRENTVIKKAYIDFFIPSSSTSYLYGTLDKNSILLLGLKNITSIIKQINVKQLTTSSSSSSFWNTDAAWSPDGTKIAFQSNRDGNYEIYVIDADGSNLTRFTTYSSEDIYPAWSPDGTKIAFVSDREDNNEVYVMDAIPGSSPTRLTTDLSADTAPAWSPDGDKIAFTSDRDGNDDLYVMDASDGSNPTLLLSHDQSISNPVWSPDGTKIAFQLFDGDIYVVNATSGSDITNLTTNGLFNEHPAWSPDGTQIAFTSKRDDNRDIYVMDADGSNQTRLTDHSLPDTKPIWSPDGNQIAFTRQDISANYQIYILSRSQELYLQTNNSSRIDNIYNSGTITITGEGSGTTSITGNTRTIMNYDGSTQIATVGPSFLSTPQDTWSYKIQYLTDRSSSISPDQLSGVPTATRIYTQPGLTVDGDPTSNGVGPGDPLNSTFSVDTGEIDAGEDFGIIQTRTLFSSNNVLAGTRRNLKTGDDE